MGELCFKPVHELALLLERREISSEELTMEFLKRIDLLEPRVKCFVTVLREEALREARRVDELRRRGETLNPLAGIPMALKDNMCTKGIRTTCSSRILEDFKPPYDATVTRRLKKANAVMVGKTNMDEFAMGSSTENSGFHPTYNPWNTDCVPGGSSGGSAAALAAGAVAYSIGSDTGGSVRQPASLCGVLGLKPTYGAVSRYGLIAFASSLDQIGPFTRDVRDMALVMNAIAGHDPRDSTSAPVDYPDYTTFLDRGDLRGVRLGIPKEYFGEGVQAGVKEAVLAAIGVLQDSGAEVEECSLPHTEYALSAYYIIAPAEASSNLARYDGVRYGLRSRAAETMRDMFFKTRKEGFGSEVKRRIMLGTYALSAGYYDAYYLKAQKVRTLIKRDFVEAFKDFDALVAPTSPTPAFRIGEKVDDPLMMYYSDILTIPVNLAGLPALSVPCGFQDGLPIGLQLIGKPFDEGTLFRIAHSFELRTDFHRRRPPI